MQVLSTVAFIRSENMSYPACTLGRDGSGGRPCQKKLEEQGQGVW